MSNQSGFCMASHAGSGAQSGPSPRAGFVAIAMALTIAATGAGGWAIAQDPGKISKFLLLKLSRDQSQVLCASEAFTSCMGFTAQVCLELSEKALQQCIAPLPDTVLLQNLNSEVLEVCPQQVYEEAGFSNDKASECLQKIVEK